MIVWMFGLLGRNMSRCRWMILPLLAFGLPSCIDTFASPCRHLETQIDYDGDGDGLIDTQSRFT